jgi:hypothetical protein
MPYGIFVHDIDGDSGEGCIVATFADDERAAAKADLIMSGSDYRLEAIVLPIMSAREPAIAIRAFVDRFGA